MMVAKKFSALALCIALTTTGCRHSNNPLLSSPSAGTSGVSLFIPQIDTNDTTENRIFTYVADQSGTSLTNFQIGNFSIVESGEPGVPFEIGVVREPLYLALAIDRSGSMAGSKETAANNAATALINALAPTDFAALVEFNQTVTTTVGFTSNKSTLTDAIAAGNSNGSTAYFDATVTCAELLRNQPGRRMLLVLTDGEDNSSTNDMGSVIDAVNKKGLSAYMVGIGTDFSADIMTQIADKTGGTFSSSTTGSNLDTIFTGILNRFNNLTYVKYRRRKKGPITVFLNYGALTASTKKSLD